MATLAEKLANQYDPSIIFHNHSANLPHLNSWIEELISLTENKSNKKSVPTTEDLVEAVQRYNVIFSELLRQTRIFSEPITRLLGEGFF
jgi:hypothetical protein